MSFLHLTTSPHALYSAEIISQQIYSTELLLKQDEKLGRFTGSLYICHTKAMTAPVEYGTKCLYYATNYYLALIVWSAPWLKLKSSHFRKCCEENFICDRLRKSCNAVE